MNGSERDTCAQTTSKNNVRLARIRALNDCLRTRGIGGRIIATPGVIELGPVSMRAALKLVQEFTDFTSDNDSHGEHDFGMVQLGSVRILWKIDYYNRDLSSGSPDPADPSVTSRVLTVLLASEY